MELILIEDVPNLGSLGDTVQVKSGYGRNFLIPKGKALLAKGKSSKEMRHRIQYIKKLREDKIELAKEQALKLKDIVLEVVRKTGPEGKLFGSVSSRDIVEMLKEKDFDFGRRAVLINTPIRSIGNHEFTVRVHSEVSQTLKIKVVAETSDKKNIVEKSKPANAISKTKKNKDVEKKQSLNGNKAKKIEPGSEVNQELNKNQDLKKDHESEENHDSIEKDEHIEDQKSGDEQNLKDKKELNVKKENEETQEAE